MRQNKQERFVEEFLIDLNATQAAIRAGYSEKTAKSQGQRLLTNVDIAAAFARAQGRKGARAQGRKGTGRNAPTSRKAMCWKAFSQLWNAASKLIASMRPACSRGPNPRLNRGPRQTV
jgi:hypothetical protein